MKLIRTEPSSPRTYVLVAIALLALLSLTAFAAKLPLGAAKPWVSFGIAIAKALLVLYFFMELEVSPKKMWIFAAAGFFWLAILIALTLTDVWTRVPLIPPFQF